MSATLEALLAHLESSDDELHALAIELGASYEGRPEALAWISRVGYEYRITSPSPPNRWKWSSPGEESDLWLEWHRVRGLDPHVKRRRGSCPIPLRRAVIERDGYVCRLCGSPVEPSDVHIDHIVPWSLGGPTQLDNLQVAHSFCNISKGARV